MIKNYESKNKNISPISLQFFGYVLADNKYVFVIHSRKSNILIRQQSMEEQKVSKCFSFRFFVAF